MPVLSFQVPSITSTRSTEYIKRYLEHWDFKRIGKVDLAILRMSIYALKFQPDIPATVTIDEAVDIARAYGSDESYRFINGVLDGILKSRHETE